MTYFKSRGPGPPPLKTVRGIDDVKFLQLILRIFVITSVVSTVSTERNKYFDMKTLCQGQFMGQENYQVIDGAVVISKNERNLDCVITFQTLTVLQRFMLRFDRLKIDCNDHLYLYDVANAVGNYKADLTCHNTTEAFGVMFMNGNYVTLRYVTDGWGTELNGFELLITAFKNQTAAGQSCFDFRCRHKHYCISKDLMCDGLNHCLDGSDETLHCNNKNPLQLFGLSSGTVVIVVISLGLFLLVLCVTLIICLCRTGKQQASPRHVQSNAINSNLGFPLQNTYNANGTTIGLGDMNLSTCNNIGPKMPGNWGHPAGSKLGYSEVRVRLYCQAK